MEREYQETDLSRRAREKLAEPIFTIEGEVQRPVPEYDAKARENVINRNRNEDGSSDPHFDPWYVYYEYVLKTPSGTTNRPRDLHETDIANLCLKLNLSDEELDGVLITMYERNYNPKFGSRHDSSQDPESAMGSVATARMFYEKECKNFGLTPRDDFPDWGDWGVALERTKNWNKKVFEVMGSGERPTRAQLAELLEG